MHHDRHFEHSMLKEIFEQPQALASTANYYLEGGNLKADAFRQATDAFRGRERMVIAASGSSRYAGLAAEIMFEDLAGLAVDVEYASEYSYRTAHTLQDPCVLVISQSGETADTLAALHEAQARGLATIAITNRAESTMARTADASLPTWAGKEVAVPATKSFTTQLATLYLLTLAVARLRGRMTPQTVSTHCELLQAMIPEMDQRLPEWDERARALTGVLRDAKALLYLGRGIHYAIAREGALKLKESAYMQAEGLPTGELKHGPNALVGPDAPVVVLATVDRSDPDSVLRYEKTLQLIRDLQPQQAQVVAVAVDGDTEIDKLTQHVIRVPEASEYLLPILEVVPLQLIAYYSAVQRGIDVDNPRNLVKAVVRE
jgi:glucosamine--fructose-6-phosphate aminotransferase (isomerizing)